jgi:hypothetical protein
VRLRWSSRCRGDWRTSRSGINAYENRPRARKTQRSRAPPIARPLRDAPAHHRISSVLTRTVRARACVNVSPVCATRPAAAITRERGSVTSATSPEQGAAGALGLVRSSECLPPELMPSLAALKGQGLWSRCQGTGNSLPAGLGSCHGRQEAGIPHSCSSCLMNEGVYDAASGRHKGHYTAILPGPGQQCHSDRQDSNSDHREAGRRRRPGNRLSTSQPDDPRWSLSYSHRDNLHVHQEQGTLYFIIMGGKRGRGVRC